MASLFKAIVPNSGPFSRGRKFPGHMSWGAQRHNGGE